MHKTKKTRKLLKKACMGYPAAQFKMGLAYLEGKKVTQSLELGKFFISLSAEQDYKPAEEYLASQQ